MRKERLSDILLDYKERHGLSPEQMYKRCGISKAYYYVLIKDRDPDTDTGLPSTPSMETLAQIANGLGMTRDEILSRIEGKPMFYQNIYCETPACLVPVLSRFSMSLSLLELVDDETKVVEVPKGS